MKPEQVIDTYEAMLPVTGKMLEAARSQDWDQLITLEKNCQTLIEQLMAADSVILNDQQQRRKVEIIQTLLANDAEIRNHTETWMKQLRHILGDIQCHKKVQQAYNQGSGG